MSYRKIYALQKNYALQKIYAIIRRFSWLDFNYALQNDLCHNKKILVAGLQLCHTTNYALQRNHAIIWGGLGGNAPDRAAGATVSACGNPRRTREAQ